MARVIVSLVYEVEGNIDHALERLREKLSPKFVGFPFAETHARGWGDGDFEATLQTVEFNPRLYPEREEADMSRVNDPEGPGTAYEPPSGANVDTLKAKLWEAMEPVVLAALPDHHINDIRWSIKHVADRMVDFIRRARQAEEVRAAKEQQRGNFKVEKP